MPISNEVCERSKVTVCHYSHMALGFPSGQSHIAYIGTLVPLVLPRSMAQHIMWQNNFGSASWLEWNIVPSKL